MALPVTVYRWDDPGAPQLVNRTPSEIISILKKCLVNGYGTQTPLGWSVAFEDVNTHKIVFKNSELDGGSGGYIRFACNTGLNPVGGAVRYSHGKVANSVDEVLPASIYNSLGAQNNYNIQWVVIGTGRSFYFIVGNNTKPMSSGTTFSGTWWFGDFDPVLPFDQNTMSASYRTLNNSSSLSWNLSLDFVDNSSSFASLFDVDNDLYNTSYILLLSQSGLNSYSLTSNSNGISNGVPTLNLALTPVLIRQTTITNSTKDAFDNYLKFSTSRPAIRGAMPGLFEFSQGGYADQPWPQVRNQNGRNYWIIKQGHVGSCNVCIDLDSWYE